MLLFILAYLGVALTIVSPCILPVLPFVFARVGQPFLRSTLPVLVGMAATFAAVAHLLRLVAVGRYGPMSTAALLPRLNEWGLTGNWTVGAEDWAERYERQHLLPLPRPRPASGARAGSGRKTEVMIDGKRPGDSHGVDIDSEGNGTVTGQRLYRPVREAGSVADHTFEIRFLDPGVQAYAFTFG